VAAFAQGVSTSNAKATGLSVYADLLGTHLADFTLSSVKAPADTDTPNDNSDALVGPIRVPSDTGQLVSDISVLKVSAKRSVEPASAHAEAHTTHVKLLEQTGGIPLIDVDVLDAVSDTKCANGKATVSADGTKILGLHINGQGVTIPPDVLNGEPKPNTEIALVYPGDATNPDDDFGVRVILNEQIGAANGNGLIVTALHVIAFSPKTPNIIFADVKVAQAQSSAFCATDSPPTDNNPTDKNVTIDKVVKSTTSDPAGATDGTVANAYRGDTVTWTIKIASSAETACGIAEVADTLPDHFTFVSSSGDLSDAATPEQDGQSLTWTNAQRWSLPAGGSLTETIVAKVADDAPFGTYTNLLDVTESTCTGFTSGNTGPVNVIPKPTQVLGKKVTKPALPATEVTPGTLPRTGLDGPNVALAAALLLGAGIGFRVLRREW
jgi:uncharacterized repeat protein (TIGR01451 family)